MGQKKKRENRKDKKMKKKKREKKTLNIKEEVGIRRRRSRGEEEL